MNAFVEYFKNIQERNGFTQFPDDTWKWPLWQWKGSVMREGGCLNK